MFWIFILMTSTGPSFVWLTCERHSSTPSTAKTSSAATANPVSQLPREGLPISVFSAGSTAIRSASLNPRNDGPTTLDARGAGSSGGGGGGWLKSRKRGRSRRSSPGASSNPSCSRTSSSVGGTGLVPMTVPFGPSAEAAVTAGTSGRNPWASPRTAISSEFAGGTYWKLLTYSSRGTSGNMRRARGTSVEAGCCWATISRAFGVCAEGESVEIGRETVSSDCGASAARDSALGILLGTPARLGGAEGVASCAGSAAGWRSGGVSGTRIKLCVPCAPSAVSGRWGSGVPHMQQKRSPTLFSYPQALQTTMPP